MVALKGPADRRPAEGSPDDGIGSLKADVLEIADKGVRETAEGSEMAERSSEGGGGMLGKFAVFGVEIVRVGLDDMMMVCFLFGCEKESGS